MTLISVKVAGEVPPDQETVGWVITILLGVTTIALIMFTLRRHKRIKALASGDLVAISGSGRHPPPLLHYIWLLFLASTTFIGLLLAALALEDSAAAAGAIGLLLAVVPSITLWRGVRRQNSNAAEAARTSADHFFYINSGELAWQIGRLGILAVFLPVTILFGTYLFSGLSSSFDWLSMLLAVVCLTLSVVITCLLITAYRIVRDRHLPLLAIDQSGVRYRPDRLACWEEITSAELMWYKGNPILELGLLRPERHIDAVSRLFSRKLWIGLQLLKEPPGVILRAIRDHQCYQGV